MKKTYYQHSIWSDNSKEWIESDKDTFIDEVVEHIGLYIKRYNFDEDRTIYFYVHRQNSAYDWKVVVEK